MLCSDVGHLTSCSDQVMMTVFQYSPDDALLIPAVVVINRSNNTVVDSDNKSAVGIDENYLVSGPAKLVLTALLAMLIIGIMIGNSLVILSVTVFNKMRTLSNVLIGSLASADLLVAIFVLPISLQVSSFTFFSNTLAV
jgi:7 transmembrane receptor (rhodopsin family)